MGHHQDITVVMIKEDGLVIDKMVLMIVVDVVDFEAVVVVAVETFNHLVAAGDDLMTIAVEAADGVVIGKSIFS